MNQYYVYAYYEPGQALPFYIGKGSGRRYREHLFPSFLRRQTPFYCKLRALFRDGYKPEIKILQSDLTELESARREMYFIDYFGRKDQGTGCLLNMTDGGDGQSGFKHTDESKLKISKGMLGKQNALGNQNALGAIRSTRRPIIQMHHDKIIRRYDFIAQVREYGFNPSSIYTCLKGERKLAYGYTWQYS